MILSEWDDLPERMRKTEVKLYYDILKKKKKSLIIKRSFDFVVSFIALLLLLPIMIILSIIIKIDSKGPIMFRQTRITQYGREFRIFKFRTMVTDAEKLGAQVTSKNDSRVTKVGKILRKYRLDEVPQLINILVGDMTFVGTRPEVPKYVAHYTNEMMATLLLPAGVTSEASISFRDEEQLLINVEDIEGTYIKKVLPCKMSFNLKSIRNFSIKDEFGILIKTIIAVIN